MQSIQKDKVHNLSLHLPATVRKSLHVVAAVPDGDVELSLLSRKIFNTLLAITREDFRRSATHSVKIADLAAVLLDSHESTDRIRLALEQIWAAKLRIDFQDEQGIHHAVRCSILSYELTEFDGGFLRFNFDPILLEFLQDPKVYSNLRMDVANKAMTSVPALLLYEMMVAFVPRHKPVWTGTVDELRVYLGVGDKYADRFDMFRSRVLEKAAKEINDYAEFRLEIDYHRSGQGGKITRLSIRAIAKSAGPQEIQVGVGKGRRSRRDDKTIDVFRQVSDEQLHGAPVLQRQTLDEAVEIAGSDVDVSVLVDRWFAELGPRAHIRPAESFLAWVRFEVRKDKSESMRGLDMGELFDDILGSDK